MTDEREAVVAYIRLGEHIHSRSGVKEWEAAFKCIADAIQNGDHLPSKQEPPHDQ